MIARRIRGIFVTAAMFGIGEWLFAMIFSVGSWLVMDEKRLIGHSLLRELADTTRWSLGVGAATGALLAVLLIVAEHDKTTETVSALRFRFWGAIAGAVPMVVFFQIMNRNGEAGSLTLAAVTTCLAGKTGWGVAGRMLRLARRGVAKLEAPVAYSPE
jgi:hypothetical protein